MSGGCTLLIEGLAFSAIDEALKNDWPILNAREGPWSDGQVVAYEIEFRELGLA